MKLKNCFPRLLISNYEACFFFYRDVLGLNVSRGDEKSGEADFKVGNFTFGLFSRQEMAEMVGCLEKPPEAKCQDKVALVFEVEDLDEIYNELRHKGITFVAEPMLKPNWGIKTAYLRDPDGNLIGMYEFMV